MTNPNQPTRLQEILQQRILELQELPEEDKKNVEALATIIQLRIYGSRCIYCACYLSREEQKNTDGYCYPHAPKTQRRGW